MVAHAHPGDDPAARRSLRRWVIFFSVVVTLLLLFGLYHYLLNRAVAARLDEIRTRGEPVTAADLAAAHPWVEGPNAGTALMDAMMGFIEPTSDEAENNALPYFGNYEEPPAPEPFAPEAVAAIRMFLESRRSMLVKIHQAAAIEHAQYPIEYEKGIRALCPHLSTLRVQANLLKLEAWDRADTGRMSDAAAPLMTGLRLGRTLRDEPLLISQLVRALITAMVLDTLERLLQVGSMEDIDLARLMQAIAAGDDPDAFGRTLTTERTVGNDWFIGWVDVADRRDIGSPGRGKFTMYAASGLLRIDQLTYLDTFDDLITAARLPLEQRQPRLDAIVESVWKLPSYQSMLTRELISLISQGNLVSFRVIARQRISRLVLAAERYRLAEGRWPEQLDRLAPRFIDAVPADPFTGKPPVYKVEANRLLIYSVGEDTIDNGGVRGGAERQYAPGTDIPFVIDRTSAAK